MQRQSDREFQIDPPMPLTIAIIRYKSEEDEAAQNVHNQSLGKPRSSTNTAEILVDTYGENSRKSIRKVARKVEV